MNPTLDRSSRFRPALRLMASALMLAFSFALFAAPVLLSPRSCPMACCMAKKAARLSATSGQCQAPCGMTRTPAAPKLPPTVETTAGAATHAVAPIIAFVADAPAPAVPASAPCSRVLHPTDARLHILNSVFLI